jgi:hypothetical protein
MKRKEKRKEKSESDSKHVQMKAKHVHATWYEKQETTNYSKHVHTRNKTHACAIAARLREDNRRNIKQWMQHMYQTNMYTW